MENNKKIKVSVLRLLAFSLVLCVLSVAVFALSDALIEKLSRDVGPTSDNTKNTLWVLGQAENLLLFPVLALACLLYGNRDDAALRACHHKEKKIAFALLLIFMYLVFFPYYVSHNMAGDMTAFDAVGDKAVWFVTQIIPISALIMYHADREKAFLASSNETEEEE